MDWKANFNLFFGIILVGVLAELFLSRVYFLITKSHFKEHPRFNIWSYIYLLLFPFISTILIINVHGLDLLKAFFVFALAGTILEWGFGVTYHWIVGQRLWTYHRFSVGGYTSLLSTPVWGMAGILFWLLGQAILKI